MFGLSVARSPELYNPSAPDTIHVNNKYVCAGVVLPNLRCQRHRVASSYRPVIVTVTVDSDVVFSGVHGVCHAESLARVFRYRQAFGFFGFFGFFT